MCLIHTEQTLGYVLHQIRSSVELVETFSFCQTLFSAQLLRLQVQTQEGLSLTWRCGNVTELKLKAFSTFLMIGKHKSRPTTSLLEVLSKVKSHGLLPPVIFVQLVERGEYQELKEKDSAKACGTWLGYGLQVCILIRVEQSLTTYCHHKMPSLMLRVLSNGFVYCLFPPTHTKIPGLSVLFSTRSKPQNVKTSVNCRHQFLATVQVQGCPWHLACSPQCIRCFCVTPPSLPSLYYQLHALYTEPSWQDV